MFLFLYDSLNYHAKMLPINYIYFVYNVNKAAENYSI